MDLAGLEERRWDPGQVAPDRRLRSYQRNLIQCIGETGKKLPSLTMKDVSGPREKHKPKVDEMAVLEPPLLLESHTLYAEVLPVHRLVNILFNKIRGVHCKRTDQPLMSVLVPVMSGTFGKRCVYRAFSLVVTEVDGIQQESWIEHHTTKYHNVGFSNNVSYLERKLFFTCDDNNQYNMLVVTREHYPGIMRTGMDNLSVDNHAFYSNTFELALDLWPVTGNDSEALRDSVATRFFCTPKSWMTSTDISSVDKPPSGSPVIFLTGNDLDGVVNPNNIDHVKDLCKGTVEHLRRGLGDQPLIYRDGKLVSCRVRVRLCTRQKQQQQGKVRAYDVTKRKPNRFEVLEIVESPVTIKSPVAKKLYSNRIEAKRVVSKSLTKDYKGDTRVFSSQLEVNRLPTTELLRDRLSVTKVANGSITTPMATRGEVDQLRTIALKIDDVRTNILQEVRSDYEIRSTLACEVMLPGFEVLDDDNLPDTLLQFGLVNHRDSLYAYLKQEFDGKLEDQAKTLAKTMAKEFGVYDAKMAPSTLSDLAHLLNVTGKRKAYDGPSWDTDGALVEDGCVTWTRDEVEHRIGANINKTKPLTIHVESAIEAYREDPYKLSRIGDKFHFMIDGRNKSLDDAKYRTMLGVDAAYNCLSPHGRKRLSTKLSTPSVAVEWNKEHKKFKVHVQYCLRESTVAIYTREVYMKKFNVSKQVAYAHARDTGKAERALVEAKTLTRPVRESMPTAIMSRNGIQFETRTKSGRLAFWNGYKRYKCQKHRTRRAICDQFNYDNEDRTNPYVQVYRDGYKSLEDQARNMFTAALRKTDTLPKFLSTLTAQMGMSYNTSMLDVPLGDTPVSTFVSLPLTMTHTTHPDTRRSGTHSTCIMYDQGHLVRHVVRPKDHTLISNIVFRLDKSEEYKLPVKRLKVPSPQASTVARIVQGRILFSRKDLRNVKLETTWKYSHESRTEVREFIKNQASPISARPVPIIAVSPPTKPVVLLDRRKLETADLPAGYSSALASAIEKRMVSVTYYGEKPETIRRGPAGGDAGVSSFLTIDDPTNNRCIELGKGLSSYWCGTLLRERDLMRSRRDHISATDDDQRRFDWVSLKVAAAVRRVHTLWCDVITSMFNTFVTVTATATSWLHSEGLSKQSHRRIAALSAASFYDKLERRCASPKSKTQFYRMNSEHYTTRTSSCCGADIPKVGTKKTVKCPTCKGYLSRDLNAARNILILFLSTYDSINSTGSLPMAINNLGSIEP